MLVNQPYINKKLILKKTTQCKIIEKKKNKVHAVRRTVVTSDWEMERIGVAQRIFKAV